MSGGSGSLTFTVKQYVAAGTYIITVTGNPKGDSVQTSFQVNGISFSLNPTSGPIGTEVTFTFSNVPLNDTTCSVSSQPSGIVTVSGCVVSNGSGSGTFVVGTGPPGDYVIEVTACTGNNGCAPSVGDFAQQVFTLIVGPAISLNPATGLPGTDVVVNGTGFKLTDQSCSISSPTNPSVVQNAGCAVTSGTETIHGSFIVGKVPAGQYVIEVTGCSGNNGCAPSQGDFAQTVLTVQGQPTPALVISPTSAGPGQTIQVSGTGFSTSDKECTLSGTPVGSASCSIINGVVSGSFIVQNVPVGYYPITATGDVAGDSASATLGVAPTAAPAIPGFPIEGTLIGLLFGLVAVALLRRRTTQQQ
jgi:hypothetical protein